MDEMILRLPPPVLEFDRRTACQLESDVPWTEVAFQPLREVDLLKGGICHMPRREPFEGVATGEPNQIMIIAPVQGRFAVSCEGDGADLEPGLCQFHVCGDRYTRELLSEKGIFLYFFFADDRIWRPARKRGSAFFELEEPHLLHALMRAWIRGALYGSMDEMHHAAHFGRTIAAMLMRIRDRLADVKKSRAARRLDKAVQALQAEPEREWTVDAMAALTHWSPSHLHRVCREQLGMSPLQFLIRVRLQKAAHLLRTTDLPIYAISDAVGYSHVAHFARLFQKHYNARPSVYRSAGVSDSV